MSGWTSADVRAILQRKLAKPTRSKYRNVRTMTPDGQKFDSRREADYWIGLKAREASGAIRDLQRQVRFWLMAPSPDRKTFVVVSHYVADFVYTERGAQHVVDVKGKRTQTYSTKKKWLELQDNIVIEEV